MTLLLFVFSILFSCAKDSDLLLDAVLSEPEIALEENGKIAEEISEGNLVTRTFTFSPTNDAYIQDTQGYDQTIIRLQEDFRTSYLMFDLSAVNGSITDAVLQFSIDSDEGDGSIDIHKGIVTNWTEENLNLENAPGLEMKLGSMNKSYKVGTPEKISLDATKLKAEVTTLVLKHSTGNDLAFASKEHPSNKGPQLIITYQAPEDAPLIEQQEETTQEQSTPGNSTQQENNTPNNNTASTEGAYYVTVNGRASNDGRSEATAWSIEHAFERAIAGDVVYIKAGDYGNKELIADNSGNSGNPIKFIGYTNTPGDLISTEGSTFEYGDQLDSKLMPLIKGDNDGTGFFIQENFVEIENFQISKFHIGVITTGSNVVLKNLIVTEIGSQSSLNAYDGFGIRIKGTNSLLENCFVLNATAEGINLNNSDYTHVNYCTVQADNAGNPTDYYFIIAGGTENALIENSYAERATNLSHGGHGFTLKDLAENNVFKNCIAKGTSFELNFGGVRFNTFEDCKIYGTGIGTGQWESRLAIYNGANNNIIKNMTFENTWTAIAWIDNDDGFVGAGGDRDEVSCGYDNVFDGIKVNNTNSVLRVGEGNQFSAWAKRNTFINCDFTNFNTVAVTYTPTEDITFKNSKFSNGKKLYVEAGGIYAPYSHFDVSWDNCTWTNVNFTPPN